MRIQENKSLSGVMEILMEPFSDQRGFLMRIFDENIFREFNIPIYWVQENLSMNLHKNTIRGLHFLLRPHTDGKLLRCTKGEIYDVIVDLRKDSPTLGKWDSYYLREDDYRWIYIPKGFAHGYCSITDHSEIIYKHDSYYQKEADCGIRWNDPEIGITWPCNKPLISEKDQKLQSFNEFISTIGGI
jgi:dTDP-4-dehydrorhamnose 3,5-epimerase